MSYLVVLIMLERGRHTRQHKIRIWVSTAKKKALGLVGGQRDNMLV